MTKTPNQILTEWMQAVNKRDIETLLSLYNKNAVLIPTFSNKLLTTPENIREYFIKLADREELSVSLHEKTLSVQLIKNEIYILSGIYCWRLTIDREPFVFEARFSYTIDASLESPIINHHSSQIPRML
ncbi:MAG: DUF4440 domain-containing protein [Ignavibacteria bacterium CG22_combo_CG10-13_8_21_14_all_37_15]|nr:DUF4440 domain-containing protein [Ignavibacteria bacterium]PIP78096.1 MAG: DUF4440 domain-containing protein [Ignavibacteria bacterium CG22_combo_CG10-13_8_21_14_all_37_15]